MCPCQGMWHWLLNSTRLAAEKKTKAESLPGGAATGDKYRALPCCLGLTHVPGTLGISKPLMPACGSCQHQAGKCPIRCSRWWGLWAELIKSCQTCWGWRRESRILNSTGSCSPCSFSCFIKSPRLQAAKPASKSAEEMGGLSIRPDPHHLTAFYII